LGKGRANIIQYGGGLTPKGEYCGGQICHPPGENLRGRQGFYQRGVRRYILVGAPHRQLIVRGAYYSQGAPYRGVFFALTSS